MANSPKTPKLKIDGLTPTKRGGLGAREARAQPPRSWQVPFLRIGHGYDLHPLVKGRRLMLAGVLVSQEVGTKSHSDGDVILHALVDAMLGALGMGDIGEMFDDRDPRWKDAASRIFVDRVYKQVKSSGYQLVNADITLILEKPRVRKFKQDMLKSLRGMFDEGVAINIKACTNEGLGELGRGEAVAAHAVVLLSRNP
jgi:2-C-methyl-D-erythritol 2,4-cyclodiphosphate synthase